MIFVCVGTQIFQFNRLLKKVDDLISQGIIEQDVFAQTGSSDYVPRHYKYKKFLDTDEFSEYQSRADLIISHAGTGALIGASKKGKNIIAVPRLARYGEHTDDHQLQIVKVLGEEGYVRPVYEMEELGETILLALASPIQKKYQRESNIITIIEKFIDSI